MSQDTAVFPTLQEWFESVLLTPMPTLPAQMVTTIMVVFTLVCIGSASLVKVSSQKRNSIWLRDISHSMVSGILVGITAVTASLIQSSVKTVLGFILTLYISSILMGFLSALFKAMSRFLGKMKPAHLYGVGVAGFAGAFVITVGQVMLLFVNLEIIFMVSKIVLDLILKRWA